MVSLVDPVCRRSVWSRSHSEAVSFPARPLPTRAIRGFLSSISVLLGHRRGRRPYRHPIQAVVPGPAVRAGLAAAVHIVAEAGIEPADQLLPRLQVALFLGHHPSSMALIASSWPGAMSSLVARPGGGRRLGTQ